MFERFTERARQVVVCAQEEAQGLKHKYIGTEHLLLGLLRVEEGVAARVLGSLGVTVEEVRAQVMRIVGEGDQASAGQVPFTPRAKKVLELALREALSIGHNYIGTEHILLGIVRENEGVAAKILLDFEADPAKIRNRMHSVLDLPAAPQHSGGQQRFRPRRFRLHRWQYRVVEARPDELPGQLDELGAEGWELVLKLDDGRFVFKRPSP
jgi:ATP-dependent Clp protease ATP-binding subunit ClpC